MAQTSIFYRRLFDEHMLDERYRCEDFSPVPRWEMGYGNTGALEHWIDHRTFESTSPALAVVRMARPKTLLTHGWGMIRARLNRFL